ncbi:hypothetical protein [Pseudomonas sp. LB3P58]|jgi:hypothetical protein
MTVVKGNDLRELSADDVYSEPQVLNGLGFELHPQSVKIFKPTGAPVYFYDVFTDGPDRVGIASLVLEMDALQVADVGHACANLSESQTDPDLLSRIADRLISHGLESGLRTVRVVVPAGDEKSIQACLAQGNICAQECLESDGKQFVWFDYSNSSQQDE